MQDNYIKIIALVVILLGVSACGEAKRAEIPSPVPLPQAIAFPAETPSPTSTPLPVPVTFTPTVVPSPAPTIVSAIATEPSSFSMGSVAATPPTPTALMVSAGSIITDFAESVLGISVNAKSASEINFSDVLPVDVQNNLDTILAKVDENYFATIDEGIALVALGIDGVDGASVGAFALPYDADTPTDADMALALLQAQFPKIADLPFQIEEESGLTVGGGKVLLPTPAGGLPQVGANAKGKHFTFAAKTQPDGLALSVWMGTNTTADGRNIVFAVVNRGKMID